MANPYVAGASAAINKTITAIMNFQKKSGYRPNKKLRPFMEKKIVQLCESAWKKGVNRGHKESRAKFLATGKVPKRITYEGTREFYPGHKRVVRAVSNIK